MNINQTDSIKLLPEHIIDQIKAGEVIERPATLIKELLENSIDAGSKNISVHIINNGMDLIAVEDDGKGISHDDLPLAFCRHATSKIDHFEDIYNLHTYGFRGEALASMASISKITCNSTQNGKMSILKIHAGETISHQEDIGSKNGTSIFVKDLFYNTPVRLKFIQSKTSEKNQLKKIIHAFLLTHPDVNFSIKWDDQDKDFYPAVEANELEKRIVKMFFKKKDCLFFNAQSEYDGVSFKCLLSKESSKANSGKHQYLFVNKRFVQDVGIHKVILNSASRAWPIQETGHYFAFIDLPSDQLDVNVHPNKTVVKLFRAPQIYSQISSSVKKVSSSQREFETQLEELPAFSNKAFEKNDFFAKSFDTGDRIKEVSNKDFHYKSPYLSSTELSFDELESHEELQVVFKTDHYAFIKSKGLNDILVVNLLKLGWFYLKSVLQTPNSSIPLLVSEPLRNIKPEQFFLIEELNRIGFEIDQLDTETFLIRAFPSGLDGMSYMNFIMPLLESNEKLSKLSLFDRIDYFIKQEILIDHNIDSFKLKNILKHEFLNLYIERNVVSILDKYKLDKIFYE